MEVIKLSDLKPDDHNANLGTERGRALLEKSLQQYGAGRSILLDKNGRIIAGNKTAETAGEIGIEDVILVRTKGNQLVAVLREDLDLDEEAARMLAYADNRVGQIDLQFDADVLLADKNAGLPLGEFWFEWELGQKELADKPFNPDEHWHGMPEFEQNGDANFHSLILHFKTEEDMNCFSEIVGQPIEISTKYLYYPKLKHDKETDYLVVVDES